MLSPATAMVGKFMKSLQDYPPRAASFDLDVGGLLRFAQQ
jgi:hypothetical protein